MCVGVEICNYCENNEATDIEHIYPKSLFPERAFRWENYLLACKTCNTHYKIDRFAIFNPSHSETEFRILRDYSQPPTDSSVMIDPRLDDPLDYFWLDIATQTFVFDSKLNLDSRNRKRAEYTLEVLGLNDRGAVAAARKNAAIYFIDRLERYVNVSEAANMQTLVDVVPEPHLVNENSTFLAEQAKIKAALRDDVMRYGHPTVWQELKRQRGILHKTNDFFNRAPEALTW